MLRKATKNDPPRNWKISRLFVGNVDMVNDSRKVCLIDLVYSLGWANPTFVVVSEAYKIL